jgi:hypothetical protein
MIWAIRQLPTPYFLKNHAEKIIGTVKKIAPLSVNGRMAK